MTTPFDEARHPIGVAAQRSGLSTDVIRAWERRYGAVRPARDAAGQRLYSDADLDRLRLLRLATEGGRAIGQVATLPGEALSELLRGDEAARAERSGVGAAGPEPGPAGDGVSLNVRVSDLEQMATALAGEALEGSLRTLLLELGFARFVDEVAAPLLQRLGDGWHRGRVSPAQEHLASAAVRRVLESARDMAPGTEERPVVVVGTFSGERHEAGALAVAAAASLAGCRVVYLGTELPVEELAQTARATGARAVCVSSTLEATDGVEESFRALRAELPSHVEVYGGGRGVDAARETLVRWGVRCPETFQAFGDALRRQVG